MRKFRSSRRPNHVKSPNLLTRHLAFESLEDRRMLSGIEWTNRGVPGNDSDGFAGVFGNNADIARNTAQGAIDLWRQVITNLNQSGGVNQLDVTINMNTVGTGFGGQGQVTSVLGGKPRAGTITLNRGDDTTGDGLGDGGQWFLDSTPLDNSEYNSGTILNPFAALPNPGSGIEADFMTLITIEMAHILGISNGGGLAWTNNAFVTNTFQADVRDAPGTLWTFDGPSVKGLMTSNNGGGGGTDTGMPVHVAYPPNQYFGPSLSYTGVADVGTAGGDSSIRYLPSHLMVSMLKDVYGYTTTEPIAFGTFHTMLQSDGELLIRGGLPAGLGFPSSDSINIFASGPNIVVEIDLGNTVPGTGISGVMQSSFLASAVTSIVIEAGDGDDSIRINPLQSLIPISVSGDSGNNTLIVVGSSGSDSITVGSSTLTSTGVNITSRSSIDAIVLRPGQGVDDIYGMGGFVPFTVELNSGGSSLNLHSLNAFSNVTINGGGGSDVVSIAPNGGANAIKSAVTFNGGGGADTLNLSNGTLDSIAALITFNGGGGFEDKVVLNDQTNTTSTLYSVTAAEVTRSFGFGGFSYSDIDRIVLNLGSGNDTVDIANGVFPNVEAHGNDGNDNFIIGGGDLTGIQPQSFDGGNGTDQITFDDHLDSTNRIWDVRNNEIFFGGLIVLSTSSFESVGIAAGTGNDEITFAGVLGQFFNIDAGSGSNTFTLGYQNSVFFSNAVALVGGSGGDTFTINDASIGLAGSVTMDGGGGFNTMDVIEPLATGYELGIGYFIPRFGADDHNVFGFSNMNTTVVTGNSGDNLFTIYSAGHAFGTFTVNGGSGSDTFVLAPQPSGYTFRALTLNGQPGVDTVTLDASALTTDESYTIGTNRIEIARGLIPETITTSSMDQITLTAGSGNDSFTMNQYSSGTPVIIYGGLGDDTLDFGGSNLIANIPSISGFTFDGQGGFDRFNIDNTFEISEWGYTRNVSNISIQRGAPFFGYSLVLGTANNEELTVNAGPGSDSFRAAGTPLGSRTIFNGHGGFDTLQPGLIGGSLTLLSMLHGRIDFDAGNVAPFDGGNLIVSASAHSDAKTVHLDSNSLGSHAGDNLFGDGGSLFFSDITALTLTLGTGADTVYAQPLLDATVSIVGNNPTTAPGDTLNLTLAAAQNYLVNGSSSNGNVTSTNLKTITYTGFETGPIIASAEFDGDGVIDGRDFLAWQRGFGMPNAQKGDGDANNDMFVDGLDLGVWQGQFGVAPPPLVTGESLGLSAESGSSLPLLNSELVDLALAVEWMRKATVEEDLLAVVRSTSEEAMVDSAFSADDLMPAANVAEKMDFGFLDSYDAEEPSCGWLTEELLEHVFG
ncbi:beta strand repeat-containing protein [Bythopirellula polymerisocia]|uniref:Uncharacterized protein n=1 Tax=Bythopirellula polymerisocia TaxID=2528003 RepID=A0A5C6CZP5_9BACT|nr:hypothetical protein [Bythopirellula polymerisocia]TWU28476.1 hypothetical protein Pla144_17660 [Bythopirellula polymerisocia]